MDKSKFRGQNLLDTINDYAVWGIIVVMILGIFFAGRDFIWYVLGSIMIYGLVYYLAQREIELRYYKYHGGEERLGGDMDQAEGKGEPYEFPILEDFKWEELTEYEKNLVEAWIVGEQQQALELEQEKMIVNQLVKMLEVRDVDESDQKEEEN